MHRCTSGCLRSTQSTSARLRRAILLAIASGGGSVGVLLGACGGKEEVRDVAAIGDEVRPPDVARTDASPAFVADSSPGRERDAHDACPETCFSPETLRGMVLTWQ